MRPHLKLLATVAAGAIVLTGCGGEASDNAGKEGESTGSSASNSAGPNSSQSQQGGQGDAEVSEAGVQWMDGFCGSLAEFSASQAEPQPESQEPEAVKKSTSTTLGAITQSADKFVSDMEAMGSSPTDGGDKFLSTAMDSYGKLGEQAEAAKSDFDKVPESDKQAVTQARQSALTKLQQVDLQKPIKQLQSNQKLAGEFQQAPKCRELMQASQQQQGGGQQQPAPGN
ncbi:hypothetical protein GCM10009676_18070 [Prauserella halophila]|uniref:Small secreted protein n=1 Tax=Prauserella halophila TaxID=185641 RepID=A0ABN1W9N3_9PSEU|nr:hypothetical protein [Prauserella halophila]MCP2235991.1 hypothetical protein [Prauserella halophila]